MPYIDFHNKIRSWTLLNFTNLALEVNPHYFGKIKLRDKNRITRFFIVSTRKRNYDQLISASDTLKNENFQFQVVVTGRVKALNAQRIPNNIKDKFLFNLYLSYYNLLKIIETIDFIIITLDRKNPGDNTYN
jgi:bisphosphoglycerate-dependent phosphoglycerate mutase